MRQGKVLFRGNVRDRGASSCMAGYPHENNTLKMQGLRIDVIVEDDAELKVAKFGQSIDAHSAAF